MESNRFDTETIAKCMLEKEGRQNEFAVIVDSNQFNKCAKEFVEAEDDNVLNFVFPRLAKNEFRLISLGDYQPSLVLQ